MTTIADEMTSMPSSLAVKIQIKWDEFTD